MRLKLIKYDLNLKYVPGKDLHIADLLSRSFLKDKVKEDKELLETVHSMVNMLSISDAKKKELQEATQKDRSLSKSIDYYKNGWPKVVKEKDGELKKLLYVKDQIYI